MSSKKVEWFWYFDPSLTASRSLQILRDQQVRLLTSVEIEYIVNQDPAYSLEDITDIIQETCSSSESSLISDTTQQQFSLSGFLNVENKNRWTFLLFTWLPRFDPLLFLTRRINSEAPTGSAKAPWVQCVKALTNLIEQTETKDARRRIRSNRQYDQLVSRCVPILSLRLPKRANSKIGRAHV